MRWVRKLSSVTIEERDRRVAGGRNRQEKQCTLPTECYTPARWSGAPRRTPRPRPISKQRVDQRIHRLVHGENDPARHLDPGKVAGCIPTRVRDDPSVSGVGQAGQVAKRGVPRHTVPSATSSSLRRLISPSTTGLVVCEEALTHDQSSQTRSRPLPKSEHTFLRKDAVGTMERVLVL